MMVVQQLYGAAVKTKLRRRQERDLVTALTFYTVELLHPGGGFV
jgi:hypothetical protein